MKEAGRKDQRGREWSGADEVRYAKSSGAGKVSNNGTGKVRVRVRVRVMERMGGSFGENERVRE